MKILFIKSTADDYGRRHGFSLIEVVLAIGIFLVTVLALVGLLGPTLQSVDEVEKTDEVSSVVNTVNAFLQSSPDIATTAESKFSAIYNAVVADGSATLFVYRFYQDPTDPNDPPLVRLEVGFATDPDEPVGPDSKINQPAANPANFADAAGTIYRVVLTPSSVIPLSYQSAQTTNSDGDPIAKRTDDTGVYALAAAYTDIALYLEGYFAMEVRIFTEDPPGPSGTFNQNKNLASLKDVEPIFTYNTAVVR
jgi:type II secretory pathway pseudopilin PulG